MKKLFGGLSLALALLASACSAMLSPGRSSSSASKDVSTASLSDAMLPYSPYPYQVLKSDFIGKNSATSMSEITVDGKLDEVIWASTPSSVIDNYKNAAGTADASSGSSGTLRSVWDGYTLYLSVDVLDNTPANSTVLEASTSRATGLATTGNPIPYTAFDGVEFAIDFWNDKVNKWIDTQGLFKISRSGKLAYSKESDPGTYESVFASPDAREYNNRIKSWAAHEKADGSGYVVELAINVYGAKLADGTSFGVDVMIQDSAANNTLNTSRTYWSHNNNTVKTSSREFSQDWGAIVLEGHADVANQSEFANNDWMLTNVIRYIDINMSASTEAMWSPDSWTALQNAEAAGKALLTQASNSTVDWSVVDQASVKVAAQSIEAALAKLRTADDPLGATEQDAEGLNTLPNPLTFKTDLFGRAKGYVVASEADWKKRAEEIRYLASIYEYGPKPDAPASHSATVASVPLIPAHWELPAWYKPLGMPSKVDTMPGGWTINANITYNGSEGSSPAGATAVAGTWAVNYKVYFPTSQDLTAIGWNSAMGGLPTLVTYDGYNSEYTKKGIAVVSISGNSITSDARTTEGAWGSTRSGTFRNFYPYKGRGLRFEISNEMAAAWGTSRAIDALEDAKDLPLVSRSISISNISSGSDYKLGDRVSTASGTTWYTVGLIDAPETPEGQSGTGAIKMLYLASDATVPSAGGNMLFTQTQRPTSTGEYESVSLSGASATVSIGPSVDTGKTIGQYLDPTKIAVTGFSINGKYAFVAALFDTRVGVCIPGASGATGAEVYRYNPLGNSYSWGVAAGHEVLADTVMHNPGRTTEVFRRFLKEFRFYERLKGIDANGDISHGYGQRLPYDHHELVASLFPRSIIELNTINDYADGSESDAISMQAARIVYRKLIAIGAPASAHDVYLSNANDLIKFNYRGIQSGEPHGYDAVQMGYNADYCAWYFFGTDLSSDVATILDTDPFYNDKLVTNGTNAYDRHYGGLKVMMPWSWAAAYYPTN